jgi:hypothetical protein
MCEWSQTHRLSPGFRRIRLPKSLHRIADRTASRLPLRAPRVRGCSFPILVLLQTRLVTLSPFSARPISFSACFCVAWCGVPCTDCR